MSFIGNLLSRTPTPTPTGGGTPPQPPVANMIPQSMQNRPWMPSQQAIQAGWGLPWYMRGQGGQGGQGASPAPSFAPSPSPQKSIPKAPDVAKALRAGAPAPAPAPSPRTSGTPMTLLQQMLGASGGPYTGQTAQSLLTGMPGPMPQPMPASKQVPALAGSVYGGVPYQSGTRFPIE